MKKGFSIPIDQWIRNGKLTEWAEDMLNTERIRQQGILNAELVKHMWNAFKQDGKKGTQIWYLLMFQEWLERVITQN